MENPSWKNSIHMLSCLIADPDRCAVKSITNTRLTFLSSPILAHFSVAVTKYLKLGYRKKGKTRGIRVYLAHDSGGWNV